MTEHCQDCDLPMATTADYDSTAEGGGDHLCWRTWNDDQCMSETDPSRKVDWRSRALAAERELRAIKGA